ncbi:hypothetical protein ES703_80831 [subsurface metagenome]
MELTTVKISKKNHELVRSLAEKTGMGLTDVFDKLLQEGLNSTQQMGKVIASDKEWAAVEITAEDLLKPDHKPGKEELDHTVYYCKACAARGKTVKLDADEQPERCPECGDKLNWNGKGIGWPGYLAIGILALAFIASRVKGVSTFGKV